MEAKSQAVKRLEEIKDGMVFQTSPGGVGSWRWKKTCFFFPDPKVFLEESKKVKFFFLEKESRELTYLYI